jgi:hypothetical protein
MNYPTVGLTRENMLPWPAILHNKLAYQKDCERLARYRFQLGNETLLLLIFIIIDLGLLYLLSMTHFHRENLREQKHKLHNQRRAIHELPLLFWDFYINLRNIG